MKLAIISDIHANKYALKNVLREIENLNISKIIILGDIFGYYPWAAEVYKMISELDAIAIKGNHDALVIQKGQPSPIPRYWEAAKHNERTLASKCPEALEWLGSLKCNGEAIVDKVKFLLFHGTPYDTCNGRYYPDTDGEFQWFPGKGEIVLLGHTHYALKKATLEGGLIINPGSVGQPRDGNPHASWCVLETNSQSVFWKRTKYDYMKAVKELEKLEWKKSWILALQKNYKGPLADE